jgi:predicted phage-related endonuclease
MITTKSDEKTKKALRLYELIELRKVMEKEEKELKDYFKTVIGKENGLSAGPVLIVLMDMERTGVDKKLLTAEVGPEVVAKCSRVTHYKKFEVKKAG